MNETTGSSADTNTRRNSVLEWILNASTIIVLVLLLTSVAKRYLTPPNASSGAAPLPVGSPVVLPNMPWASNRTTLLFVLQTNCPFCEASVGFYRDLLGANSGTFHPVAVFPEPATEGAEFLRARSLNVADVRFGNLSRLHVTGTPTLMLVGSDGLIQASWIGMLTRQQELDVFDRLHLQHASLPSLRPESSMPVTNDPGAISAAELAALYRVSPIVDIRPRPEFDVIHIVGSVNIPLDEIEARAPHELPKESDIFVVCEYCAPCQLQLRVQGGATRCSMGLDVLREVGFSRIRTIRDDFPKLQALGIKTQSALEEAILSPAAVRNSQ